MTSTEQIKIKEEPLSDPEDEVTPEVKPEVEVKTEVKSEVKEEVSEELQTLLDYGLDSKVANRITEIYKTGKLTSVDLDTRALDALKEFPIDGALAVLTQFTESNLEHVSNKSAYLCGVMKTYRQKNRGNAQETNGVNGNVNANGPDESKIKAILDRTGYTLDVTTGQRKYGGPPPDWPAGQNPPSMGCEVFCGKIPRDVYEDELIPLFEKCGRIWDLRLMMDPLTGLNRGYAFVTFTERQAAQEAVRQLDSHELSEGKTLKVNVSEPKTRLFIGNIPKSKAKKEIQEEFSKLAAGLREVIIYSSPDDKKKNRGFCFLEYESHKSASLAKRRLETGRVKVWSCDIIVDWADPQEEPDDDTMSQVKVLYVRNLTTAVTEDKLRELFEEHGKVERVKKIKDYAFVHFEEREQAKKALEALNGVDCLGSNLEISLAKPPSDKKKKEDMLRKREQRMMKAMAQHMVLPPFPPFPGGAYLPPMGGHHPPMPGMPLFRGGNHHHHHPRGNGHNQPRGQYRGGQQMGRGYDQHNGFYNAWGAWGEPGGHWGGGHAPHHAGGHAHNGGQQQQQQKQKFDTYKA